MSAFGRQPRAGGDVVRVISRLGLGLVCSLLSAPRALAAESPDFHIARQPGIVYLQAVLMEEKKLVEKHGKALGIPDLKMQWSIITSGGVMTEAGISGSIDMARHAPPLLNDVS